MAAKTMTKHLSLPTIVLAVCCAQYGAQAATRAGDALLSVDVIDPPAIELRPATGGSSGSNPTAARANEAPAGNPLWAIPLSALTATRERPLFAPTRRPLQSQPDAPVAAVESVEAVPVPVPESRVALTLIGTVATDNDGIAILAAPGSRDVVRLRIGDVVAGWMLQAVRSREVTFRNGDREDILTIQIPNPAAAMATPDYVPNRPHGEAE